MTKENERMIVALESIATSLKKLTDFLVSEDKDNGHNYEMD
jgi:hypothetical protein